MASSITVIDTHTTLHKASIVGSAGLLAAAQATISALRNCRVTQLALVVIPTGRYLVTDKSGEELASYDAIETTDTTDTAPHAPARPDASTPKQIAYLRRLVAAPPYELRNYARQIQGQLEAGRLSKGQASYAISRLTWTE